MRCKLGVVVAVAVVGVGLGACGSSVPELADVECSLECPPGTKLLNFEMSTYEDAYQNGAFVYAKNECETTCAPITPCQRPNVPVVTADAFECQGLPGISDLPPPMDVQFDWMTAWDEGAVTP